MGIEVSGSSGIFISVIGRSPTLYASYHLSETVWDLAFLSIDSTILVFEVFFHNTITIQGIKNLVFSG